MASPLDISNTFNVLTVPLPWMGEDCFGSCSTQRWPNIIFQVFWYPLETEDRIVLLGEAAAPPVTTLGSHPCSFRLRLTQFDRRAPRNSISLEDWHKKHFSELQRRIAEEAEIMEKEQQRQQGLEQELNERARNHDLQKLQEAMRKAFSPTRTPNLLASTCDRPRAPNDTNDRNSALDLADKSNISVVESSLCTPRPLGEKENDTPPKTLRSDPRSDNIMTTQGKKGMLGFSGSDRRAGFSGSAIHIGARASGDESLLKLVDGSYVRLPSEPLCIPSKCQGIAINDTRSGDRCYLDVDLAWAANFDATMVKGEGKLRVDLHSVIAPICNNEGSLRVRVCEVETPFSALSSRESCTSAFTGLQPRALRTDAAAVLARQVNDLEHREIPRLPELHPLWLSDFSDVGFRGTGEVAKDFAQWSHSTVLNVSQSANLLRHRQLGLLKDNDAMEPVVAPPPAPPEAIPVQFEWEPVQLPAAVPMPRCRQRLQASAFYERPLDVVYCGQR